MSQLLALELLFIGLLGLASLAIAFGRNVLFPEGGGQPNVPAIVIMVAALSVLRFTRIDVVWVIAGGALAGLALGFVLA